MIKSIFPKSEGKCSGFSQFMITVARELSEDPHQRLVHVHNEGKGYKAISKQDNIPVATIQSIINKHKQFNAVKNLSWCGRKVSPKLARKINGGPQ